MSATLSHSGGKDGAPGFVVVWEETQVSFAYLGHPAFVEDASYGATGRIGSLRLAGVVGGLGVGF